MSSIWGSATGHPLAGDRRREAGRGGPHRAQPPLLDVQGPAQPPAGRGPPLPRNWGVSLDPESEITNTISSKEGFSPLMWVLLQSGDAAIVPSPSYPIHIYGPLFAGADLRQVPMRTDADFFEHLEVAWNVGWPKPRVLIISFPHNPTGACVDAAFMQRVVDFCREHQTIVVHDFACRRRLTVIARVHPVRRGRVRRRLYSMTKSFDGRLAGGVPLGQRDVVAALVKLKTYSTTARSSDQIAATVTMNEAPEYPQEVCSIYRASATPCVTGCHIGWRSKPGG